LSLRSFEIGRSVMPRRATTSLVAALGAVVALAAAAPAPALADGAPKSAPPPTKSSMPSDADWDRAFSDGPSAPKPAPASPPPTDGPPPTSSAPPATSEPSAASSPDVGPEDVPPDEEGVSDPYVRFWRWATESLTGYVAVRDYQFLHGEDEFGRRLRRNRLEGEGRLQYKRPIYGPLSIIAEVDIRADDDDYMGEVFQRMEYNDLGRPIVNWNDAYLLASVGPFDFRGGFQTIGWGTGDFDNPTDNINPKDVTDLFYARKIGVLALRGDYYIADFGFQAVYIPFLQTARLPPEGKRFSAPEPSFGALPVDADFVRRRDYPSYPAQSQYAARVTRSIAGFDLSASYYLGYNKIPVVQLTAFDQPPANVGDPIPVTIRTELKYEKIQVFGADFATTLGWLPVWDEIRKFQVHGEAAFVDSLQKTGDDYFRYVFGVNYTLNNVILDHDIGLFLDYIDETMVDKRTLTGAEGFADGLSAGIRPLVEPLEPALGQVLTNTTRLARRTRGSIATRASYQFSSSLRVDTTVFIVMRGPDSTYVQPQVIWDMTDNIQVGAGMDIFGGKRDGSFFGNYDGDDRCFFTAKVSF